MSAAELPTPEEIEAAAAEAKKVLLELGRQFFQGIETQHDLASHLYACFREISGLVERLAARAGMTAEEAYLYSVHSTFSAAMIEVLRHNPMFGTPQALELQLQQCLRKVVAAGQPKIARPASGTAAP